MLNKTLPLIICTAIFGASGYMLGYKHGTDDAAEVGDHIISEIVNVTKSREKAGLECSYYYREQNDHLEKSVFVRQSNSMIISKNVSLCSLDLETKNYGSAKLERSRVFFYLKFDGNNRTKLENYSEISEQEFQSAAKVHNARVKAEGVKSVSDGLDGG